MWRNPNAFHIIHPKSTGSFDKIPNVEHWLLAVDWESLGQSKAKSVCALVQELNESVSAKFVEESPEALLESNPGFFSQFTLVIATQVILHPSLTLHL
jgi:hypothetical protein